MFSGVSDFFSCCMMYEAKKRTELLHFHAFTSKYVFGMMSRQDTQIGKKRNKDEGRPKRMEPSLVEGVTNFLFGIFCHGERVHHKRRPSYADAKRAHAGAFS